MTINVFMLWIQFLISTIVIVFCGIKLTRYADVLSDRFDLGKAWMGVFLLGLITSLPEAFTSIWSIVGLKSYDLALGNILGSNNFNPMIVVLLDLCCRGSMAGKIRQRASHEWGAKIVVFMSVLVFIDLWFGRTGIIPKIGYISVLNVVLLGLYFWGMYGVYRHDKEFTSSNASQEEGVAQDDNEASTPVVCFKLFVAAVLVIIGAVVLSNTCDHIAEVTGLGRTFIGTLLLALVTSLPEIVVSLSALRLGCFDMAMGNVVGSNMTNLFILEICCFLTTQGPFLSLVSPVHAVALISSLMLLMLVVLFMRCVAKPKIIMGVSWISYVMVFIFVASMWSIYVLRTGT